MAAKLVNIPKTDLKAEVQKYSTSQSTSVGYDVTSSLSVPPNNEYDHLPMECSKHRRTPLILEGSHQRIGNNSRRHLQSGDVSTRPAEVRNGEIQLRTTRQTGRRSTPRDRHLILRPQQLVQHGSTHRSLKLSLAI